jgi:hypothetical protein
MVRAAQHAIVALGLIAGAAPGAAQQQQQEPVRIEARVDGIGKARGTPATVHAGGGVARRFGMFHLAALAGAGPSADGATARVEAVGRFHVDPFRQRPWGLYGAAGAGVLWSDSSEPYLLFAAGAEGSRGSGGWSPALEIGLARGLRVAVALRRTPPGRR